MSFNGGAFSDVICVSEQNVAKIPVQISMYEAAALSINYITAFFSLFHLGNLLEDGAVLIYSAGGLIFVIHLIIQYIKLI